MDRNREARRTTSMAASNGLSRRRHRNSVRDSSENDGPLELTESVRLRDRGGSGKKERDRDRDRDRERDRDRDRLSRSKRRRADRLTHGSNRDDASDETSEDSVNDDEEEDDEDGSGNAVAGGSFHLRVLPRPPDGAAPSLSSSLSHHNSRRSFPPAATGPAAAKVFRPVVPWKPADEMIGVSVPRKARTASTKRSHEWLSSGGHVAMGSPAELGFQQASASPARSSMAGMTSSPVRPASPSSSNASGRKKMKSNGPKPRPRKLSSKSSSSDQDEIEIEIAEVLYGMMRQPEVPSSSKKEDSKSLISSSISNSASPALPLPSSSMSATASKRKKPRPVKYDDEDQLNLVRGIPMTALAKTETDQPAKIKAASAATNLGGTPRDSEAKPVAESEPMKPESAGAKPDMKALEGGLEKGGGGAAKEEPQPSPKCVNSMIAVKVNEIESEREEKFQIDLMAPPPSISSPESDGHVDFAAHDPKPKEVKPPLIKIDEKASKVGFVEQGGANGSFGELKSSSESHEQALHREKIVNLQLHLEKNVDIGTFGNATIKQLQANSEKTVQPTNSLSFPMSVAGWPGAIPPVGFMAPLQGVVSMDGSVMAPGAIQPPQWLFNQPRPKKCATHYYIARNIHFHQQLTRMNPFWPAVAAAGSAPLYGASPCNLNNAVPSAELPGRANVPEKAQNLASFPVKGSSKPSTAVNGLDSSQRKQQQQIIIQQSLPPGTPSNLLGPAFIFPLSQQHATTAVAAAAASVRSAPAMGKAQNPTSVSASSSASASASASAAKAMSFSYPGMSGGGGGGETQYLAILQNNGYPFPVGAAPPSYRAATTHGQGAMPFFNGPFYSSPMLHPSQLQQHQNQPAPVPSSQSTQSSQHNSSTSGGPPSSSQKQQRPLHHRNGNLQGFPAASPATKDREASVEDSPLSARSNSAMPVHPPNFTLLSPAQMAAGANSARTFNLGHGSVAYSQQQHMMQLQKQHQFATAAAAAARSNKTTSTSNVNVSVCAEQNLAIPSYSSAVKTPNTAAPHFQQSNLSSSSQNPNQSPTQWRNSPRGATSQVPPSSLSSTTTSSAALKSHHQAQQQGVQPLQAQMTQISFAAAANSARMAAPNHSTPKAASSNQLPTPPLMVGSSTTSSMSKSMSGSPRTSTAATSSPSGNNKNGNTSALTAHHHGKSSLGNSGSHIMASSGSGLMKHHQLPPQQLPKHQQTQLFFTHPYVQVHPPPHHQGRMNPDSKSLPTQGASSSPSSPVSLANNSSASSTCDPVKAVAASSMTGAQQEILSAAQFAAVAHQASSGMHQVIPAGFPYLHAVQGAALQVKAAAEQKQQPATAASGE